MYPYVSHTRKVPRYSVLSDYIVMADPLTVSIRKARGVKLSGYFKCEDDVCMKL